MTKLDTEQQEISQVVKSEKNWSARHYHEREISILYDEVS